jgi:hypothetical protein
MTRHAPLSAVAPTARDHLSDVERQGLRQHLVHLLGAEVVRGRAGGRHVTTAVGGDLLGLRQALRDALHKLDEGAYGGCERCRGPIPLAQLERVPYARCCAACLHDEL